MFSPRKSVLPASYAEDTLPVSEDKTAPLDPSSAFSGSEAGYPRTAKARKRPPWMASILVFLNHIRNKLGLSPPQARQEEKLGGYLPEPLGSPAVRDESSLTWASIDLQEADSYERSDLFRRIAGICQRIDSAHSERLSLPFADRLCSELDAVLDELDPLAHLRSRTFAPALRDVVKARNELVLIVDFLEHEEIDPLPRLVLRNKALFKLGNALCDALLSWPLQADRSQIYIHNMYLMGSGEIYQIEMNRPAGDHSTPPPPPEKKATEPKKKSSQGQKKR